MLLTFIWVQTKLASSILSVNVHQASLLFSNVLIRLELLPRPTNALNFLGTASGN